MQQALSAWLSVKEELRLQLDYEEWSLAWRSAKLLKVLSDKYLLIALPPSQRIHAAAKRRKGELNLALTKHGFGLAGFTVYPDDWTREEIERRFPEVAYTMLGGKTKE